MSTEENDWLDRILEDQETSIADDGFTQRVLGSLPRRQTQRLRTPILVVSGLLAGILGFVVFPGGQCLVATVANVVSAAMLRTSISSLALVIVTLLVSLGAALVAEET
jgi:hypothetical protein